MRLLVVHAWLRGNLGDALQASVLLRSLRQLRPSVLDLAGYPGVAGEGVREIGLLVDNQLPEPFQWHWQYAPQAVRTVTVERGWRRRRAALFSRYDAIVSAPGAFLADYDARSPSALCDIDVAADQGVPFVLASHSIGPLSEQALDRVSRATICVSRESTTHRYLTWKGINSVLSADLSFVYPYEESGADTLARPCIGGPYRLAFLSSSNISLDSLRLDSATLRCGDREIALRPGERVVFATTDVRRDGRFLSKASSRLGALAVACRSIDELVTLVSSATGVVSDYYHPAICAIALGKPVELVVAQKQHEMIGLRELARSHDLEHLQKLSRTGLEAIRNFLVSLPGVRDRSRVDRASGPGSDAARG
jgi:polysaccharide pyruvyl transferase WcaK-like protein